ncbi:hypothetical protein E2C01_097761 [Portunus trituberculatus]|uniref:Uncharacterized protein n=1 Tax=Portunus trituberculatus TaxID=210409 RepID=A0A5B7K5N7_PORTR|nr:hypothetical protein [Portunus trituberculatus]
MDNLPGHSAADQSLVRVRVEEDSRHVPLLSLCRLSCKGALSKHRKATKTSFTCLVALVMHTPRTLPDHPETRSLDRGPQGFLKDSRCSQSSRETCVAGTA